MLLLSAVRSAFILANFMKVACIAVVKNEERHIAEWLAYYLYLGFDSIIILDNLSADSTREICEKFSNRFDVRLITSKDDSESYQKSAYMHAISNYKHEFDWMAFFDIDEFLALEGDSNIKTVLDSHRNSAAIGVQWAFFGSSGHRRRPEGLTIENFLYRSAPDFGPNRHIKSIVRPERVSGIRNGHCFQLEGNYFYLNGQKISWKDWGVCDREPSYDIGKLNHYFTRSLEDWFKKLKRGYPDLDRKLDEFSSYDQNVIYDDSSLKYVDGVRSILSNICRPTEVATIVSDVQESRIIRADDRKRLLSVRCRAKQSSVSQWSRGSDVYEDAAGALNGEKDGTGKFHTDIEDEPWWYVDLGEIASISKIVIFNRVDQLGIAERASRLAIDVAFVPERFAEVYRRERVEAFGGIDGNPLVFEPTVPVPGQFVRIRLLRRNYLHLDQVEVYGEPCPASLRLALEGLDG